MEEERHRLRRSLLDRELDVREHRRAPALGDDEGPALPGGIDGEGLTVDDPDTRRHRIDPETLEGQVEEGHRRMNAQGHRAVEYGRVATQLDHRGLGDGG